MRSVAARKCIMRKVQLTTVMPTKKATCPGPLTTSPNPGGGERSDTAHPSVRTPMTPADRVVALRMRQIWAASSRLGCSRSHQTNR